MRKLFIPGFLGLSMLLGSFAQAPACEDLPKAEAKIKADAAQPKISFRNDGNDVIASIQVTANGSPHALSTSYDVGPNNVVTLRYCLIQNSDILVRCIKTVTIEWRLKNFAVLPSPQLSYRVDGHSLALSTKELKALIPQLQGLNPEERGFHPDEALPPGWYRKGAAE
ncbi:MAG TPA: hypothetical protein VKS79_03515 [Gemmataceae bacterium]|nr:hypothetical protein [Gemmataceae bacterium]